jgi:subtilisin family serine protease
MKKGSLNLVLILMLVLVLGLILILIPNVISQSELNGFQSFNYQVSGSGSFVMDISQLDVGIMDKIMSSLLQLKNSNEIENYYEEDNRIRIDFGDNNIEQLRIDNKGLFLIEGSQKYIIEFHSPPVLEKQVDLNVEIEEIEEEIEEAGGEIKVEIDEEMIEESVEEVEANEIEKEFEEEVEGEIASLGSYKPGLIASSLEKDLAQKEEESIEILSDYKEDLVKEHSSALADIQKRVSKESLPSLNPFRRFFEFIKRIFTVTGFVVSENEELIVKREYYNSFNGVAISVAKGDLKDIIESPYVKRVYLDKKVRVSLMDSVPLINANEVWLIDEDGNDCSISGKDCLTGEGITIAIIDTGIDYTHSDLGGCLGDGCKVIGGYDFVNDDEDPMDDQGHGTHCAGIAAGNGNLKGVAPNAELYAYKVLDEGGSGSMSDIIMGIEKSIDPNGDGSFSDHLDVISLSLGGWGNPDDPMSQAIDRVVDLGVIAVIAAGNSGPSQNSIGSPGTARNAITVGAIDKEDVIAEFSSRGPVSWEGGTIIKPDIVAPGVDICSAQFDEAWEDRKCYDDEHVAISGTSMATPHVAGAVALLKQANPSFNPKEIKSIIKTSAKDLGYEIYVQGNGKINVLKALNQKIVIEGDLNFGNLVQETNSQKSIIVKNIDENRIFLRINIEDAKGEDGDEINALSSNIAALTLEPGESKELFFDLNFPLTNDGFFIGKIVFSDEVNDYLNYYTFARYSELILDFEGEHYPNYVLHDNEIKRVYGLSQDWDFFGSSGNLFVKSGTYTVYAINDFVNPLRPDSYLETDEYNLNEVIEIPIGSVVTKTFSLDGVRKFTFKAESLEGEQLYLYEWAKGIKTYKDKTYGCRRYDGYIKEGYTEDKCINNLEGLFCYTYISEGYLYCNDRSFSFSSGSDGFGDREIYIQNKPDNGLETDIDIKYWGSSENE